MKRKKIKSKGKLEPRKIAGKVYHPIVTGTDARTFTAGTGVRQLGPVEITIQMQMSPLSVSSEEMKVCMFCQDPGKAAYQAAEYLKHWYRESRSLASEGYPKPSGDGTVDMLEKDSHFDAKYRDVKKEAARTGGEVKTKGPKEDPTVFHLMRKDTKIYMPGS